MKVNQIYREIRQLFFNLKFYNINNAEISLRGMITDRQIKILNSLIQEYIESAEPISSELLNKKCNLGVSPATIRNELQDLMEQGYITQPHTSAGRVPTQKGYRYFVEITFTTSEKFPDFILNKVEETKQKVDKEIKLVNELSKSLSNMSSALSFSRIEEDQLFEVLKIMEQSRISYDKHFDVMKELLNELENF